MTDRVHPALAALEEMFTRYRRFSDLCAAMNADATDRLALEMMFYCVHEPNLRLGEMAEKLDRAFGVSPGFFANIEKLWLEGKEAP